MANAPNNSDPVDSENDELLSAYLDGQLSDDERALVEQRLQSDAAARETLERLRFASEQLRSLPPAPGPGLTDEVLRRVNEQLADGRDASKAAPSGSSVSLPIGRSRRGWFWAGLAVAASLAMAAYLPQQHQAENLAKREVAASDDLGVAEAEPAEMNALPEAGDAADAELMARSAVEPPDVSIPTLDDRPNDIAPPMPAAPPGPTMMARSSRGMAAEDDAAAEGSLPTEESESTPVEPAPGLAESPLLVVRVKLSPAAFERRVVDRVLGAQGIAVEPDAQTDETRRGSPPAARSMVFDNARNALPAAAAAPSNLAVAAATENDRAELLVVEAPAAQFAAVLNDLRNDYFNCNSLEVTPPDPAEAALVDGGLEGAETRTRQDPQPDAQMSATSEPQSPDEAAAEKSGDGLFGATPAGELDNGRLWLGFNRFDNTLRPAPANERKKPTAQQADAKAFAYKLQRGEVQQLAEQSRMDQSIATQAARRAQQQEALRQRAQLFSQQLIPAPSDPASRVQALVIVEPDLPEMATEATPAAAAPAGP